MPQQNIRMRVKTGEYHTHTLIIASEQFTTAKWGCVNVSSNTSSGA